MMEKAVIPVSDLQGRVTILKSPGLPEGFYLPLTLLAVSCRAQNLFLLKMRISARGPQGSVNLTKIGR